MDRWRGRVGWVGEGEEVEVDIDEKEIGVERLAWRGGGGERVNRRM